jgi:hypothetical protein
MATPIYNAQSTPESNLINLLAEQKVDGQTAASLNGQQPFEVLAAKAIYNVEQKAEATAVDLTAEIARATAAEHTRVATDWFLANGITADRRMGFVMGSNGNMAGLPLSEVGHIFQVPETIDPIFEMVIVRYAATAIPANTDNGWSLSIGTNGELLLRVNTDVSNRRAVELSGWRAANSGKIVRLDITTPADSAAQPLVYQDGVLLTGWVTSVSAGTPPNWQSAGLSSAHRQVGFRTNGIFIPGTPINRVVSAAEILQMISQNSLLSIDRIAGSSNNIVANGGFETAGAGGNDVFANWIEVIDGSGTVARDTSVFNSGAASLRFTTDGAAAGGRVEQVIGMVRGRRYRISFNARSDVANSTIQVRGGGLESSGFPSVELSTDWAFYSVELIWESSNGSIGIVRSGGNMQNRTYWVDDFSIVPIGAVIQSTNTGTSVVMDTGTNRIHGQATNGVRPLRDGPLAPIELLVTTTSAFLTGSSANPLTYDGPVLIDRIVAVGSSSGQILVLRNNSSSTNNIITSPTTITTAGVPQDLTLIGAQRTLAALVTLWGATSVGPVRLLVYLSRA